MGIWDFINPTTDALKRNAPDLTPVKDACLSSYSYGRTAVTKVNNAVTDKVIHGLNQHLPDDEGRDKIGRFAKHLAKNAADYAWHEGLKCVPGGDAIHKIVSRTVHDEMAFQARMGTPEKEFSGFGKTFEQAEICKCNVELGSGNAVLDSNANKKPEDLIRIFMTKEYIGNKILGDLIIREGRRGKNGK